MKEKLFAQWQWSIALIFVFFFAAWFRLVHLGNLPPGLTWDEAALGYVGKMVITTGFDEHGQFLPRVFQSFGDFKAPLAIYLTGLFTSIFGLSATVVRLPFALAGIASVFILTRVGWLIFRNQWYALLMGWLLATAPWHIHFSRIGFESGLSLLFHLLILWSWLEIREQKRPSFGWFLLAAVATAGGTYVYHSAKITIPLFWILVSGYEFWTRTNYWRRQWQLPFISAVIAGGLLFPMLLDVLKGTALERAQQTTILTQDLPVLSILKQAVVNFLAHFSPRFLLQGETATLRHGFGDRGILLWTQAMLLLAGITATIAGVWRRLNRPTHWWMRLLRNREQRSTFTLSTVPPWFWLAVLLISILPAAIGFEVPHANRALFAIIPMTLLMGIGVRELERELPHQVFATFLASALLFLFIEFGAFWRFYTTEYPQRAGAEWLDGYAPMIQEVALQQQTSQKIKVDNFYGEPAIFFGFYQDIEPATYRAQRVPGVQFGPIEPADWYTYEVIVAANPITNLPATKQIYRQDGSVAFYVYRPNQ